MSIAVESRLALIVQGVCAHARAQRSQLRTTALFLLFWFVWAQAQNIDLFIAGFLDGFAPGY